MLLVNIFEVPKGLEDRRSLSARVKSKFKARKCLANLFVDTAALVVLQLLQL